VRRYDSDQRCPAAPSPRVRTETDQHKNLPYSNPIRPSSPTPLHRFPRSGLSCWTCAEQQREGSGSVARAPGVGGPRPRTGHGPCQKPGQGVQGAATGLPVRAPREAPTRNRDATCTATAIAVLLLAAGVAGAGPSDASETMNADDHVPDGAAVIDPGEVHQRILDGEVFEAPTPHGSVTVEATERVQRSIASSNGPDQPTVERPPNVWELAAGRRGRRGARAVLRAHAPCLGHHARGRQPRGAPRRPPGHRRGDRLPGDGGPASTPSGEPTFGTLSHIQVYRSVYAYVDTQYRDQYGSCCWADQVVYILDLLKTSTTSSSSTTTTAHRRHRLRQLGHRRRLEHARQQGLERRRPALALELQGLRRVRRGPGNPNRVDVPDPAPLRQLPPRPAPDHERPACLPDRARAGQDQRRPSQLPLGADRFQWPRAPVDHEGQPLGHYHNCWSQTNLDRMASYLGTSVAESPC
jgi:hypothetical protein